MKIRLLSPGALGLLFLSGYVFAAQPTSVTADGENAISTGTHTSSKPQAPIDVQYQIQSLPEAGQPLTIELRFSSLGNAQIMDATFHGEAGLQIRDHGYPVQIWSERGDPSVSRSVTVVPSANGLYHLNVFANVLVEGRLLSRAVAIPVQVGPKTESLASAEKPDSELDTDGVAITSMPARSSITVH